MKLIAFDVDGTILDTLDTIMYHVNETLNENGFYKVEDKQYMRKILGYGSEYLIEKSLDSEYNQVYDKNITKDILDKYTDRYNADPTYLTKPYEKIKDLLEVLKSENYLLAAYSNKPDVVLQPLIVSLFGENLFDIVLG
ncbi:HAD family hydrolase, partial [Helcococcus kunzii]